MSDLDRDPIHASVEAWELAAIFRERASAMGRDVVVLCAAALLEADPDGMRRWMRAQKAGDVVLPGST